MAPGESSVCGWEGVLGQEGAVLRSVEWEAVKEGR